MSFLSILIASFLGSPHCAGMCGPLVVFFSGQDEQTWHSQVTYNLGRLLTYITLGALGGLVGSSLDDLGLLVGIQRAATIITGILLLFWGLKSFFAKTSSLDIKPNSIFHKVFIFIQKKLVKNKASWTKRAFFLGLLTTLLPCGWLYAFVLIAVSSSSLIKGTLVMFIFWLGTLPIMSALGLTVFKASPKIRKHIPRVTAVLLIASGLFALSGKSLHLFNEVAPAEHHCHTED